VNGLPEGITACLFDLDGVLTSTAEQHKAAWKQTFDAYLRQRDPAGFREFTAQDYLTYVDGRPRADGVREFLRSRHIDLPDGDPDDPPAADTVNGIGNRKNVLLHQVIEEQGVTSYAGSMRFVRAARDAGIRIAVVTSSANGEMVLAAAGYTPYIEARIDGVTIAQRKLRGKPAPDSFLAGAQELGVEPANAAVFEDALAGVAAGRAGGFGFVVGVNRTGQAGALRENGADVVVEDLAELLGTP
jgi:beta-phosphoglucomutase family hydrolase